MSLLRLSDHSQSNSLLKRFCQAFNKPSTLSDNAPFWKRTPLLLDFWRHKQRHFQSNDTTHYTNALARQKLEPFKRIATLTTDFIVPNINMIFKRIWLNYKTEMSGPFTDKTFETFIYTSIRFSIGILLERSTSSFWRAISDATLKILIGWRRPNPPHELVFGPSNTEARFIIITVISDGS